MYNITWYNDDTDNDDDDDDDDDRGCCCCWRYISELCVTRLIIDLMSRYLCTTIKRLDSS